MNVTIASHVLNLVERRVEFFLELAISYFTDYTIVNGNAFFHITVKDVPRKRHTSGHGIHTELERGRNS